MYRHQDYDRPGPQGRYELLRPAGPAPPAADDDLSQLAEPLRRAWAAGVRDLILIHGTFVGSDPAGLARKLSRVWPRGAAAMRLRIRDAADALVQDAGNYDDDLLRRLQSAAERAEVGLKMHRLDWSGENHHAGRADGAAGLLRLLSACRGRTLVLSHSHGGNVAALTTQLLESSDDDWHAFLAAARPLYRRGRAGSFFSDRWQWAVESAEARRFDGGQLDVVTSGAPVRYGWGACGELLHFVHHRPSNHPRCQQWQAEFPPPPGEGDWVQQLGIAGTNLPPGWLSWRARRANRRLSQLLQGELRRRDLLHRLRRGVRLHDAGQNLLVDYRAADPQADAVLGHAVYTRLLWLPFHLQQVADRCYGDRPQATGGRPRDP